MAESATRPKRYAPWFDLNLAHLPLPGLVSIFHRIGGFALFVMLWFLLWLLDASLSSEEGFQKVRDLTSNVLVKLVLLGLLWSFLHHFCAGIRYLFLDMHLGIELPSARGTSAAVFVISIALTILIGAALLW